MTEPGLTRTQILATAAEVLRRYGPTKATVVDVARALGVSHGSVYRHFASKAALRDAVTAEWLSQMVAPLAAIVTRKGSARRRLRAYLETLMQQKRSRALDDPEIFATYMVLAGEARDVVRAHVEHLVSDLAAIITDGVARGELAPSSPAPLARALLDATARFHHPAHAREWSAPDLEASFSAVWRLIEAGL